MLARATSGARGGGSAATSTSRGWLLWALLTTTLVRDEDGGPAYFLSQVIDISDRKHGGRGAPARRGAIAGADRRDAGRHPRARSRRAPTSISRQARRNDCTVLPRSCSAGDCTTSFRRTRPTSFLASVHAERWSRAPRSRLAYDLEIDGERYYFEATVSPLPEDRVVVGRARRDAAQARRSRRLRESEDQLRQAQKMEAVGQLAGGVAHDFNNLLTAIMGYASSLRDDLARQRAPARATSRRSGAPRERARALTRQLLAFSRKQMLQPRVLDLERRRARRRDRCCAA